VVREGSFRHVKQLSDRIMAYLGERNANPTRYTWNAKGEDILRKNPASKTGTACIVISETVH